MTYVNRFTGMLARGLLDRFERPWPALVVAAGLTAAVLLVMIRLLSRPEAVVRGKNRLVARVLELVLYRHDPWESFTAGGRILRANLAYLRPLLLPLLISSVPFVLIVAQLAGWFAWRPLRAGEAAVLEVACHNDVAVADLEFSVSPSAGIVIESPPVRIPSRSELAWRLRALAAGNQSVEVKAAGMPALKKQIAVGDGLQRVSPRRAGAGLVEQCLYPAEEPIAGANAIDRIDVYFPRRELELWGLELDWLLAFVMLTILFGLALKRPFGVTL